MSAAKVPPSVRFTSVFPSTATTPADTRESVVSEALPSSTVVNCGAVSEERIGVPQTVGMFVLSISVNHHFTIRVPVAQRFVKNPVAHRISEEPRLSVLSVSETSEVLIATPERFDNAVLAHAAGISEVRARVPVVAGAVRTIPVPATALGWIVTSPEVFP